MAVPPLAVLRAACCLAGARSAACGVCGAAVFDLVAATIFLPGLVAVGAGVTLTGRARAVAIFLGQTSYAVYLTQGSLIIAAAGVSQALIGRKIYDLGPGSDSHSSPSL